MKQFLVRRWFLIALAAVLTMGLSAGRWRPDWVAPLVDFKTIRYGIVFTVLFLMAFPIAAGTMWRSMRRPFPPLLASAINFGLLPLVAWGVSKSMPVSMAAGLLVAATTPSTLASGALWTRRAGGNDAVALMVTMLTNLVCFVVTPAWLLLMISKKVDMEPAAMIVKLACIVVLPMTLAQLVRLIRPIGWWATRQKMSLGVLAQFGVLSMIFLGSIKTGLNFANDSNGSIRLIDVLPMLGAVLGIHLAMMYTGFGLSKLFRQRREDGIAVGISGSQKTLMVGLQVGIDLNITILPMVAYHVGQLLVDTLIADRLRKSGEAVAKVKSRIDSDGR